MGLKLSIRDDANFIETGGGCADFSYPPPTKKSPCPLFFYLSKKRLPHLFSSSKKSLPNFSNSSEKLLCSSIFYCFIPLSFQGKVLPPHLLSSDKSLLHLFFRRKSLCPISFPTKKLLPYLFSGEKVLAPSSSQPTPRSNKFCLNKCPKERKQRILSFTHKQGLISLQKSSCIYSRNFRKK